jgi:hypothetical protein
VTASNLRPSDANPFRWKPPSKANPDRREVVEYNDDSGIATSPDATQTKWHAELTHFSTYPAPLPHAAKLGGFFYLAVADVADIEAIVAAPKFTFPGDKASREPDDPGSNTYHDGEAPILLEACCQRVLRAEAEKRDGSSDRTDCLVASGNSRHSPFVIPAMA